MNLFKMQKDIGIFLREHSEEMCDDDKDLLINLINNIVKVDFSLDFDGDLKWI